MIRDVQLKPLTAHADERGYLMEILRTDDEIFEGFGQCYVAKNYPGVVRAWHYHRLQTDYFVCVHGMIKVALYDLREDSSTRGEVNEFFLGEDHRVVLKIPVGVYHGYKTVGTEPSLLLNFPTRPYNPQEPDEYREPYNSPEIPYSWEIKIR
ncbi:MAG: dTDP-4-dehydrorhamnose 3,5-epimerase family protein [Deinococcus sp.]|nr:dTDP-4-dehydrorhamnose 3,5-epimerase family protein [Deinococcus sp.]